MHTSAAVCKYWRQGFLVCHISLRAELRRQLGTKAMERYNLSCTLKALLKMHSISIAIWIIRYVQSVGENEKNNHQMRKCSHLKCSSVRKKENHFIFKATGVSEKVLRNQFISKGMNQTDYAFFSSIGTVWIQCRCIDFMHM